MRKITRRFPSRYGFPRCFVKGVRIKPKHSYFYLTADFIAMRDRLMFGNIKQYPCAIAEYSLFGNDDILSAEFINE